MVQNNGTEHESSGQNPFISALIISHCWVIIGSCYDVIWIWQTSRTYWKSML